MIPTNQVAQSLLVAFDRAVAVKSERFYSYRHEPAKDVFLAITQPDAQIKALVSELYNVFREMTGDRDVKLVLARVENDLLSGKLYNAPSDAIPRSPSQI